EGEMLVDEVDDLRAGGPQIGDTVSHPAGNVDHPRLPGAKDKPHPALVRRRLLTQVHQAHQQPVTWRNEPQVFLAEVDVKGLDGTRHHSGVIDLIGPEAGPGGKVAV